MPTWEYCAVVGISISGRKFTGNYSAIYYFTANGVQVVEIHGREDTELARSIARLGEEGWEMVGVGALTMAGPPHMLYFKRPKP